MPSKLKKDVAITFVGQLFSLLLGVGVAVVLARALGPGGRGLLALALLVPTVAATFARLGQETVNSTYAGLYKEHRSSLFVQTLVITVVSGCISALAVCAFFFWLPIPLGRFSQLNESVIWAGIAIGPATIFGTLMTSLVRGVGRIGTAAVLLVVQNLIILATCLILLVGLDMGIEAAIWSMAAGPVVVALCGIWLIRKDIQLRYPKFEFWLFKKSLSFGARISLATLATFLIYRIDQGILAYYVSEADVGLYVVAVGLAERLRLLPNSVGAAFLPLLANELADRQKQVPQVFRCTVVISSISMLVVGILGAPLILLLFGTQFLGSLPAFFILLPGVAALGGASVLSSDLLAREKPHYAMVISYVVLTLCVVLNLLLVAWLGIIGAAATSSITYLTALAMVLLFYHHESGVSLRELRPTWKDMSLVSRLALDIMRSLRAKHFARS